ncbi:MAG TPA: winged helix DNA-binding domain-containing protein, partial [Candidatus Eisenbacteria bacterium]|nr:winged helix DNA-binding domain-containing protein [Candidatus Eisenbacteria bacterium]
DLVALHSTDPASVFLSAAARMRASDPATVERALYEDRTLVRLLGMRRTMCVVPLELVPVVHAACTRALVPAQRRRIVQVIEQAGIAADGERWLRDVEEATLRALAVRGEASGAELAADVPGLRRQIVMNEGKSYGGASALTTRVLFVLAAGERIVRGRPRGSWISSQYRWAPIETWLRDGVPDLLPEEARADLVRRWLRAFGPGTAADLRWWTGWTAREVDRVLREVRPVEVQLDGRGTGLVLGDDLEPAPAHEPWAALLPALDPTVMGWTERAWFLGEHAAALFDRSGNAGPTVWWDGRVVGGWAQRRDGEIVFRLLEDVGADALRAIEDAASRLAAWIGPVRVTPRFRTPMERELSA